MRKIQQIILAICVLMMPALLIAQTQAPGKPALRQRLLKQFDKDGDGKLSEAEREAARRALQNLRARNANQAPLERMTWTINREAREALVYLPKQKTAGGSPVVFGFHGHGGNMQNAERSFGFEKLWPEAIVVYMQGLPTPGQLTDPEGQRNGWQHDAEQKGGRDLKFFDAVLKTLREKHEIDKNRIYASGHSNGGGFSYLLWTDARKCSRPSRLPPPLPKASERQRPKPSRSCTSLAGRIRWSNSPGKN